MIHYCTYFDQNYLTRGLALYRSLEQHSPQFTLWVLALDKPAEQALLRLDLPRLNVVALEELEESDQELLAVKASRSRVEYYFTCTPSWPHYLLKSHPEIDLISYLDADLLFYSDPTPIFQELGDQSILIIPHRFPRELEHKAIYGVFNVGMVSFRNDRNGRAVLESWRADCIEWCYDRLEDDKFADQRYLDSWPEMAGVHVLEHLGAGLGPWNAMRYRIDVTAKQPTVDGWPLIFYHFQGVKALGFGFWDLGLENYGGMETELRSFLYRRYTDELNRAARRARATGLPGLSSGRSIRAAGLRLRHLVHIARPGFAMFNPL